MHQSREIFGTQPFTNLLISQQRQCRVSHDALFIPSRTKHTMTYADKRVVNLVVMPVHLGNSHPHDLLELLRDELPIRLGILGAHAAFVAYNAEYMRVRSICQ